MESKREATKVKLKERILKAAIDVFFKNGYENTTINQIAKVANVGTGTAYNYFDSKADLFIQAMESLVTNQKYNLVNNTEDLNKDPIKELTKIINRFFKYLVDLDNELVKELFSVIFGTLSKNNYYMKRFYQLDEHYIKQIKQLLQHYIEIGKFPKGFDVDSCTLLIFSSITVHMLGYLYSEDFNKNNIELFLENQIKFILEDKVVGQ